MRFKDEDEDHPDGFSSEVSYSPSSAPPECSRVKKSAPPPPASQPTSPIDVGPAMAAYHSGDDCAINELLEGRMELDVILPDGRQVRLTVERRTPMMDLLVQATTANKISPGGHVIHIWTERGKDFVHYKPSTPIGSLDTNTIYIVPKKDVIDPPVKRMPRLANQPFEPTFRLQVHLPRNQLMVLRVSPRLTLAQLRQMVCEKKGLDPERYQLVHPSTSSQILDGSCTLADYGSTEISLLSNSSIQANICNSTSDLIAYSAREDDRKRKGILGLISQKTKGSLSSSSDELDGTAEVISKTDRPIPQLTKPSGKKRPAPPPPPHQKKSPPAPPVVEIPPATSHSRHSSDSSGYHEASIFEDAADHSAPETSSGSSGVSSLEGASYPNETVTKVTTTCNKKRKAPPPPLQKETEDKLDVVKTLTLSAAAPSVGTVIVGRVSVCHTAASTATSSLPTKTSVVKIQTHSYDKDSDAICEPKGEEEVRDDVTLDINGMDDVEAEQPITTDDEEEAALVISVRGHERKVSVSSLATLDDIQDSFDQTIAEAQKVLDEEENEKKIWRMAEEQGEEPEDRGSSCSPVTKLALATLNARIEQDVTQQEIASHIEAAFCTLKEPSSKQTHTVSASDEEEWRRCPLPKPPAPLGADRDCHSASSESPLAAPSLLAIKQKSELASDDDRQERSRELSSACQVTASEPRPRLSNFSIGSYADHPDSGSSQVHSLPTDLPQTERQRKLVKSESFSNLDDDRDDPRRGRYGGPGVRIRSFLDRNKKPKPNDNKVYGVEGSVRGIKGQVRLRCSELVDWNVLPGLRGRSSSLLDLAHPNAEKKIETRQKVTPVTSEVEVGLKRSHSAQNLRKSEFVAEQERLQREYARLQQQFVLWQKQLLSNHAVLQEERIMPASSLPSLPARVLRQSHSLPNGVPETAVSANADSALQGEEIPAPNRSAFMMRSLSYEPSGRGTTLPRAAINIPVLEVGTHIKNGMSTLRSSTNKTHFKPPQVRATTKSRQRLPPEVRREDESASDLLVRIHEELKASSFPPCTTQSSEENSVSTKLQALFINGAMKKTDEGPKVALHSGQGPTTLKKPAMREHAQIEEQGVSRNSMTNGHSISPKKIFTNGYTATKLCPTPFEFPKKISNDSLSSSSGSGEKNRLDSSRALNRSADEQKPNSPPSKQESFSAPPLPPSKQESSPPPPPPPLPVIEKIKDSNGCHGNGSFANKPTIERKPRPNPVADPREELMLEIRNFGGRRALRKISLDPPNWQINVFGQQTSMASA